MKPFIIAFIILFSTAVQAAYYDTLPVNVINFTYRYIKTGHITGSYNNSGDLKGYNVRANINADAIRGLNAAVDTYLDSLSAEDYAQFSFGTFEGTAQSKVEAQAFGAGYGVSEFVTVYAYVPYYKATVDLQIERTAKGRNNAGGAIQLENLPDVDVRLIQSLFVNYYGYQPLGQWKASDFGDTEIGIMIRLFKNPDGGLLMNLGAIAPTGKKDNPDILQDIAFGSGQWDAFVELGGGKRLNSFLSFDQWNRVTYQFASREDVRFLSSSAFPVSSSKGTAKIKPGNVWQSNFQTNVAFNDHIQLNLLYSFEYTARSEYSSSNQESDKIFEAETEKNIHTGRANLNFSTTNLYRQQRFPVPLDLNFAFQSHFAGKNTPRYERYEAEVRLYF